jgi:hypothetical protein
VESVALVLGATAAVITALVPLLRLIREWLTDDPVAPDAARDLTERERLLLDLLISEERRRRD